jgi:hypothetical protein
MSTLTLTTEEKSKFEMHVAALSARSGAIVDAITQRVPGTTVKDESWAWHVTIEGRGRCLLRKDGGWLSVRPADKDAPTIHTFEKDATDEAILDAILSLIATTFPAAPTPPAPVDWYVPVTLPRRRAAGSVRKTEVERLQAEGRVFQNYRV